MRQGRWRLVKLSRQGTARGAALVVQPLRVIPCYLPIKGIGQCARLHRANPPDASDTPGPNAATGDELLQSRTHRLDREAVGCPRDLVGARIREDLIMQEEEVHPVELQAGQALVETPFQQGQDLAGCPVADGTLGRDADACWQSAPKGLAEHHLGFATAIAWCHIEKGDARRPRLTHGRNRLRAGGWTPDLTNAAPTKGEGTDVTELPKGSLLHG